MNIIETSKLTKYYGEARGIIDVDLTIEEGELYGFIGPNGAGKSTTIRLLLSLIYPTSGSAKIFGKDVFKYGADIKKYIGYLPSEVFYYDNMKVSDLLKYSASFYKKDNSKRIKELVEIMDLDASKRIDDLSYGNKKKVGIVQGLLHEPKLIILDEPTGGLDPLMQQNFFNLLEEEHKKGVTILLSSHVLGEVQRLCNRVAIIKDGKIVNVENMSNLGNSNYSRVKLKTKNPVAKNIFNLAGVSALNVENHSVGFMFKGDINSVTRVIASLDLVNLLIEEPDLEEIFLHYYE
jgi:ABC-2 type transport system ATP-binding protein